MRDLWLGYSDNIYFQRLARNTINLYRGWQAVTGNFDQNNKKQLIERAHREGFILWLLLIQRGKKPYRSGCLPAPKCIYRCFTSNFVYIGGGKRVTGNARSLI